MDSLRTMRTLPKHWVAWDWLLATIVLVSLSLLIDATDVIRYVRGDRDPYLEPPT